VNNFFYSFVSVTILLIINDAKISDIFDPFHFDKHAIQTHTFFDSTKILKILTTEKILMV